MCSMTCSMLPPTGLLPAPSLPRPPPAKQEGLQETPHEAWSVCPLELGGYNGSMSGLSLRNLKGKRLTEGAYKCDWEVTSFPQTAGSQINVGHTRRSWRRVVLDPPRKAVLKDKKSKKKRIEG